MERIPYNIPDNLKAAVYTIVSLMEYEIVEVFKYLKHRMGLEQYPLTIDLSVPFYSDAFGMYDSTNMRVNIFIGSIVYCIYNMTNIRIDSDEGINSIRNTIYNVLIHELSHAGQRMSHKTKKGFRDYHIKTIEEQNYHKCYSYWYPNLCEELKQLFNINPFDCPFNWSDLSNGNKSRYVQNYDLITMCETLALLINGNYDTIYDDYFNHNLVDLSVIATDLYNNIIGIAYVGFIKKGFYVPEGAFENMINVFDMFKLTKRAEEHVYYSSISEEANFCRIRVFVRVGYYCPIAFNDKKDKTNAKKEIARITDQSETSLYDVSDSMKQYVDDFVTDKFGAIHVTYDEEEGK